MKKFLIAAAGLSAFAAAAPAAAQGYYGQPQGYGYGYNYNQQGLIRSYLIRADQLRRQIDRLDNRDRISEREARRLRGAAIDLQYRTRSYARNGLSGRERYELDRRFASLQRALYRDVRDGNYQWRDRDRDGQWDRRDQWVDRDRDGRDDRWERRVERDDD